MRVTELLKAILNFIQASLRTNLIQIPARRAAHADGGDDFLAEFDGTGTAYDLVSLPENVMILNLYRK